MALELETAIKSAPYQIEKERYLKAAQEINRLQALVDAGQEDQHPGQERVYKGDPWHADETDDCVRIFLGNLQIIKAPKRNTPYEEYWPEPDMLQWILDTLNKGKQSS